ncbi:DUF2877 domain-containing protein [Klebsiella aerogenes]
MKTLNALACNGLEQLADGVWQRHSRFSQAVNFVHADGTLLTLFRYGKGMGPTGILLSSTQFAQLANLPRLVKQGRLLWGAGVAIRPRRTLKLRFPVGHSFPLDLSAYSRQSGLRVALNQPLADMPFYSSIMGELECWRRGDLPDWGWLIGKGPGLTPSGDDMLAGMLAMLYGAGFSDRLHAFIPPADQLTSLTTSVSCSYLNSARRGEFSLPVVKVMRGLRSTGDPKRAIQRLLAVGHTSGADTLLGMAFAQHWLQRVDSRRTHARSGNHPHVYTGRRDRELLPRGQSAAQNAGGD